MYEIKKVENKKDLDQFVNFAWEIYKNDPTWVPPLKLSVKTNLDIKHNPFYSHAKLYPILCTKDGKVVGRMAGVIDQTHNDFHKENTAFFGFFESIDDPKVAETLIREISSWAKENGMNLLRGPMNPSTNHECGLLVEGFNDPPQVMMTYNPPYYEKLLTDLGFVKTKDLLAWDLSHERGFMDTVFAHAKRVKRNSQVVFRSINMKRFDAEVRTIFEIYNDAWEKNWGFVPMTNAELDHLGKELKSVVDPDLIMFAEVRGKPAGFSLVLPDINQALKKIPNGKLLPFGIFKLLWNLKGPGRRKVINRCRIITLGIKKEFQELGLGPIFYSEIYRVAQQKGYYHGEASWILEDNLPMTKALQYMKAQVYKRYRLYDRSL